MVYHRTCCAATRHCITAIFEVVNQATLPTIKTHNTEEFRRRYMRPGKQVNELLKPEFGKFFIVKVEDLLRQIKLPVPPNRADTHTLIYLTSGEANMSIGGDSYCIHAHQCFLVPAGQVFAFARHDVNEGYLCNFHNDFVVGKHGNPEMLTELEFLNVYADPRISLQAPVSLSVQALLQRIYACYYSNAPADAPLVQALFRAVLWELRGMYKPVNSSAPSQAVAITNRFRQLLVAHIRELHKVSDYAAMLHISPNHLNKVVKLVTGKSPTRWIDDTLVLEAKVLLYQGHLTVGQVSAGIGILDASYFSRLFRKQTGMTPQQFRAGIEKS